MERTVVEESLKGFLGEVTEKEGETERKAKELEERLINVPQSEEDEKEERMKKAEEEMNRYGMGKRTLELIRGLVVEVAALVPEDARQTIVEIIRMLWTAEKRTEAIEKEKTEEWHRYRQMLRRTREGMNQEKKIP